MNACLAHDDALPLMDEWHAVAFAPPASFARTSRMQRGTIGAVVVALHALLAWFVELESRPDPSAAIEDEALAIDFVTVLPRSVIVAPREAREGEPAPRTTVRTVPRAPPASHVRATRGQQPPRGALRLYLPDGSLQLPEGLLADIDKATGADRQFDFQFPDLEKAGRFLDHPPALAYEETRFEQYWRPEEDLLQEILRRAVEKTTKEVRIPLPGSRNKQIVCRVSLLAAGGACGIERKGDYGNPGYDDPATLSAGEAAACQAWWERITGPTTQSEWRATRKLYEAECRKPLERKPPEARPDAGAVR
jgi:hypothetical protein